MNNIEDKLKNIKEIKLTASEKNTLRTNFLNKISSKEEVIKPFWLSTISPLSLKIYSGAFAVLLLTIYTGSAETALPGDKMYYFKTHLNEPVVQTLAFTPQMKAHVSVKLLNRRYEEVSKLSINTETNKESWIDLQDALTDTTRDARENVQELVENKEYAEASSLINDLSAVLEANKAILSSLDDTDKSDELDSIIETLATHQMDNLSISAAITESLDNSNVDENIAESLDDSESKLKEAGEYLFTEQETGDTVSARILSETIEKARLLVEEGKKLLSDSDEVGAFLKFEEAKKILDTSLYINEAENDLRIEIENFISTSTDSKI